MPLKFLFPAYKSYDIIQCTDNFEFESALDIGLGYGGASLYFAEKGKKVTAIGKADDSHFPSRIFSMCGIDVKNISLEEFDPEKHFDAVYCSHMLEHCENVSNALQKMRALLKDDGWLFLLVPPYKSNVVCGHISTGFNLIQLMLILYFNGFLVKNGHFCFHGYNIVAFVQKNLHPKFMPSAGGATSFPLIAQDFPIELTQGMEGDIENVNWFFDPVPQRLMRNLISPTN